MGQAKQRGTFEERQKAAYERIDANIEMRKKEIEEMDALEKRQMEGLGTWANAYFTQMERHNKRNAVATALTRTDFSQLELRVLKSLPEEEQKKYILSAL